MPERSGIDMAAAPARSPQPRSENTAGPSQPSEPYPLPMSLLQRRLIEGLEFLAQTSSAILQLDNDLTAVIWNPSTHTPEVPSGPVALPEHIATLGISESDVLGVVRRFAHLRRTGEPAHYEIAGTRHDGTPYRLAVALSPFPGLDPTSMGMLATFRDISAQRKAEIELEVLARSDALTGLANRAAFQEALGRSLARYRRFGVRGAILFLDVDGFKSINDELGHNAGDNLLCEVSRRLSEQGRDTDTIARLGGDEFAVLLDPVDSECDGAMEVAHRVLDALSRPYQTGDREIQPSMSCGVAYFPEDGRDPDTLLRHADKAMYSAKRKGGGQSERYRGSTSGHEDQIDPQEAIRAGIRNHEFDLHFQPIVDLGSGNVVAVEGLARWHRTNGSTSMPAQFLPCAEETGLIVSLGYQLFEAACVMATRTSDNHELGGAGTDTKEPLPIQISVNLSRRQFAAADLVPRLASIIQRHGVDPSRITLEITETTAFDNLDLASKKLKELRELHLQIALDDFGTGYGSLSALSHLPLDTLKLDQMFVKNLLSSDPVERTRHKAIILAAVRMGQAMGLTVVAEGVESETQHDFLRRIGCDRGQGNFYAGARPSQDPIDLRDQHGAHRIPKQDDAAPRPRKTETTPKY